MASLQPVPVRDGSRDRPFLPALKAVTFQPVFVVGLHRSGTTFLYETLASSLPVARQTIYHAIYYQELLWRRAAGCESEAKAGLDAYFCETLGATRGFDELPLTHATVDEYCSVLRQAKGCSHLERRTAARFDRFCRKLCVLQPGHELLLLKNPWDAGHSSAIWRLYPEARFVAIQRDPLRILDSLVRTICDLLAREHPHLKLMIEGVRRDQAVYWLSRQLYWVLGPSRFRRWVVPRARDYVVREIQAAEASLSEVPVSQVCRVTYEELISDPASIVEQCARFLGQGPLDQLSATQAAPRERALLPEVEAQAKVIAERLPGSV